MREEYDDSDRGYDHIRDERRPMADYRMPYGERHRRDSEWDEHDPERRRMYDREQMEPREWEREMPPKEDNYREPREWTDRQWGEQEKWAKEKDPKEWKQYGEKGGWPEELPPHKRMDHPMHSPHPGQGPPPRRWPPSQQGEWQGPIKEGHPEYRKPFHPHPPHPHHNPIKPTSAEHQIPPAAGPHPYKRHILPHQNPYHFNYKRFHFNKKLHMQHPNPKFNLALKPKMMNPNQAPQNPNLIVPHVQKTPIKTETIVEAPKKVEVTEGQPDDAPSSPAIIQQIAQQSTPQTVTSASDSGNVEADTTIEAGTEEDNLSNVSDSDDEILNRDEVSSVLCYFFGIRRTGILE